MFKMAQKNTNEKYEIFLYPCRDKIKLELSICAKTFSSFISNIEYIYFFSHIYFFQISQQQENVQNMRWYNPV